MTVSFFRLHVLRQGNSFCPYLFRYFASSVKSSGGTNNIQSKDFSLFPKMCQQNYFRKPTNPNNCNDSLKFRMGVMDPELQ